MKRFIAVALALTVVCGIATAQLPEGALKSRTDAMAELQQEAPGVLFYLNGESVSRIWGVPFAHGATPENSAAEFMQKYAAIFTPGSGKFVMESALPMGDYEYTVVRFLETVDGLPMDNIGVTLLVKNTENYPVILASSNARYATGNLGLPTISAGEAIAIAQQKNPWLNTFTEPVLVAHHAEDRTRLAWDFIGDNNILEWRMKFRIFVDARTGAILEWRNMILDVDVNGHVDGWYTPGWYPDQPNNPPAKFVMPGLQVSIVGGSSSYTDAAGNYVIPNAGSSPVTVRAEMKGRWVRVQNQAGSNYIVDIPNVTPPGPANFELNPTPTELITAQLNGFIHTEAIHNFVKQYDPTYPGVDIQMPCNVNINSSCNAYYDYSSINFYRSGGGCPNTAYSGVIYHEYGHHIVSAGGSGQDAYGEGMGDVMANIIENTPCLGQDFRGQGSGCLRNADNNLQYPCSGEIHYCGQLISGCVWHTLDALKAKYPEQQALDYIRTWAVRSVRLHRGGSIDPSITIDYLTLDDNDGNIYNGTPNYNEIESGFGRHNMHAPPIDWVLITPVRLPQDFVPIDPLTTSVFFSVKVNNGAGTLDPNSVKLYYSVDGGAYQTKQMVRLGSPDVYSCFIPRPACGSSVKYYVEAKDTNGNVNRHPRNAPNETISFLVAFGLDTVFEDNFQTDKGWTVTNQNVTAGAWARGVPAGGGARWDPPTDGDGSGSCYVTGLAGGDNDLDGGPTILTSPTFALGTDDGVITFYEWFADATTNNDTLAFEISNNNGSTWVRVDAPSWDGQQHWVKKSFTVRKYITPTDTMKIRFVAQDNPNDSVFEGGVDGVVIKRVRCQ